VRGGLKLNRTLHESPATASLHSVTPKRKNVPYSFDFRGGGFFLKWKGHFSFWGSALQVFGQCGGAKCGTRTAREEGFEGSNPAQSSLGLTNFSADKMRLLFIELITPFSHLFQNEPKLVSFLGKAVFYMQWDFRKNLSFYYSIFL